MVARILFFVFTQKQCFFVIVMCGWAFLSLGFFWGSRAIAAEQLATNSSDSALHALACDEAERCDESLLRRTSTYLSWYHTQTRRAVSSSFQNVTGADDAAQRKNSSAFIFAAMHREDLASPILKIPGMTPQASEPPGPARAILIQFDWPELQSGLIELTIHDLMGRPVRRLFRGELPSGKPSISWDGNNDSGQPVPAGKYWYRTTTARRIYSRMLILVH